MLKIHFPHFSPKLHRLQTAFTLNRFYLSLKKTYGQKFPILPPHEGPQDKCNYLISAEESWIIKLKSWKKIL